MFNLSDILDLLNQYLWAFVRIGSVWMAMPVFGSGVLPARLRLVLAWSCALIIAPLLPTLNIPPLWSAAWWLTIVQEIVLGFVMAFSLALVFEMSRFSAELLGLSMGLGFAQMTDPLSGTSAPVLGQYFNILVILLFFAAGGHLQIVEWLTVSLIQQPPGQLILHAEQMMAPLLWASNVFSGALQIALPGLMALLLLNLSLGVVSRAAPALNLFAIGFPASLLLGLLMMLITLPLLQSHFTDALSNVFEQLIGLWT